MSGAAAGAEQCRCRKVDRDRAPEGATIKIADIIDQVAGVYPKVMVEVYAGAWSYGMVSGQLKKNAAAVIHMFAID
jgi:hypothetical protein